MLKILRILGHRGRVTIPYAIRVISGFKYNDVVSFTLNDDNSILIKREKLCDDCHSIINRTDIDNLISEMPEKEQKQLLIDLSYKWAAKQGGFQDE